MEHYERLPTQEFNQFSKLYKPSYAELINSGGMPPQAMGTPPAMPTMIMTNNFMPQPQPYGQPRYDYDVHP